MPPAITAPPMPNVKATIVNDIALMDCSFVNNSFNNMKVQVNPLAAPRAVINRPTNNKE